MSSIQVNNTVYVWDEMFSGWTADGALIKTQRVNVGTKWESVNYDKYTLSGRYLGPIPTKEVTTV